MDAAGFQNFLHDCGRFMSCGHFVSSPFLQRNIQTEKIGKQQYFSQLHGWFSILHIRNKADAETRYLGKKGLRIIKLLTALFEIRAELGGIRNSHQNLLITPYELFLKFLKQNKPFGEVWISSL